MIERVWKDIEGYEGSYQVSNMGEVRSLDRVIFNPSIGYIKRKGKILKVHPVGQLRNYPAVQLNMDGVKKNFKVHRLVAVAFLPNPENKPEVNHINGNTFDNTVTNLEWVTPSENQKHALATGLLVRGVGEDCANTKYKIHVYKDGEYVTTLVGTKSIVDFGLMPSKVMLCVNGERKTHKGFTYEKESLHQPQLRKTN